MREVEADPAAKVAWDVKQAAKEVREEARKAKQVSSRGLSLNNLQHVATSLVHVCHGLTAHTDIRAGADRPRNDRGAAHRLQADGGIPCCAGWCRRAGCHQAGRQEATS